MRSALVTGGAGFIGAHLVRALLRDGWDVAVLDDFSTGKRENIPSGVHVLNMPVVYLETYSMTMKPDVVFHLAAQSSYRLAMADPFKDLSSNVYGTLNVCCYCVDVGARLVFASSAGGVYGDTARLGRAARESDAPLPTSPYGVSKLAAEEYIGYYVREKGLRATILRLANVYGPGQDPHGEAGVVAIFAGQAVRGEPLTVRGDGQQVRDFVHVADVVRAFLYAADCGRAFDVLNIASGASETIMSVAERVIAAVDPALTTRMMPAIAGEPQVMRFNPAQAWEVLGWQARRGMHDGLRDVLDAVAVPA